MPYIIRPGRLPARALAACSVLLAFGAGTAQAEITSTSQCTEPTLTQPFLSAGDSNYYTLTPGEESDSFGGQAWTLSPGASIKETTLEDGSTGSVLDLADGSKAVSPTFCITTEYPTARVIARNVAGASGVAFAVSYMRPKGWSAPKNTGQVHGNKTWTLTTPVNMQPEKVEGWQLVRITLTGAGPGSDNQLYNLYIDPYKR